MLTNPSIIKSRQHPLCKLVRALGNARRQREHGLFVASGGNAVAAALQAGWPMDRLIVAAGETAHEWESLARKADVPCVLVDPAIMAYLGDVPSPPDVMALVRLPKSSDAAMPSDGLTLVLDGIGDPGNLGTLIRTADAVGASAVLTSENSCDPFGQKAVRSSAGSVFHLPPRPWPDRRPETLAARLRQEDVPIVIAAAHEGQSCFEYHWPSRCALVLGHETRGVASPWETAASARLTIPVYGRAESLNVAAAGAVLLYAWRADVQRRGRQ